MDDMTKYKLIKEIVNNFYKRAADLGYYESYHDMIVAAFEHIKLIIDFNECKKDKKILNE